MFKVLDTPIDKQLLKEFYKIPKEYPNLAYILINLQENQINGITYPHTGDLYAIADKDGLKTLYKRASELRKQGIQALVCDYHLEDDIGVLE